jgi:hypothetical protein
MRCIKDETNDGVHLIGMAFIFYKLIFNMFSNR